MQEGYWPFVGFPFIAETGAENDEIGPLIVRLGTPLHLPATCNTASARGAGVTLRAAATFVAYLRHQRWDAACRSGNQSTF